MATQFQMPDEHRQINKMPGHWVLAKIGKKVLRPGGRELTEKMLQSLKITQSDHVVEFAPGMGFTAKLALNKKPATYTAIERNEQAAAIVESYLNGTNQRCQQGLAEQTGLAENSATVVYGEAMLTMQTEAKKQQIVSEAARILQADGRYGIHELCIVPDNITPELKRTIQKDIAEAIQAPAKPITPSEWRQLLTDSGFSVSAEHINSMGLLEPKRVIRDEGVIGALKVISKLILNPEIRQRVLSMRRVFRRHRNHLCAISLVGYKSEGEQPHEL